MEAPGKPPESQVVLINGGDTILCCVWEVHDPLLMAEGRGGGIGGIDSSNTGCFRVCYLETHPGEAFSSETDLIPGEVTAPGKAILRFSRSDLSTPDPLTPTPSESKIAPVAGVRTVDIKSSQLRRKPNSGTRSQNQQFVIRTLGNHIRRKSRRLRRLEHHNRASRIRIRTHTETNIRTSLLLRSLNQLFLVAVTYVLR